MTSRFKESTFLYSQKIISDERVVVNNDPEKQTLFANKKVVPGEASHAVAITAGRKQTKKVNTIIFEDSIPKGIRHRAINQMLKNGSAQFKIFPGCDLKELYHYFDPTLENGSFGNAVIHVGTNDINNKDSSNSLQLLENLRKIAEKCFSYGIENIFISSVGYSKISNSYFLERVNAQIAKFCKENNYGFIDHSNINSSHLYDDGLHLLESGKIILANNSCLITFFPQSLSHPNRW